MVGYIRQLYREFQGEILPIPWRTLSVIFIVSLFFIPLTSNVFVMRVFIMTNIYVILAVSWDFLAGFLGQLNFGQVFFFGGATYVAALLNIHLGLPPWATIIIGALAAMVMGLILAFPVLRLRGLYFALATLAFPIIATGFVNAFSDVTGGTEGLGGIDPILAGSGTVLFYRTIIYYIVLLVMVISVLIMWKFTDGKSKLVRTGVIFHAIREDEITARASGINTTRYKLLAFIISGFFAGIAGGLYVHFLRSSAMDTLSLALTFQIVLWTILGGLGTIYGAVIGVYALYPLMQFLTISDTADQYRFAFQALLLIVILLFMPQGIAPWVRDKLEISCERCKTVNSATRHVCRVCLTPLRPERE